MKKLLTLLLITVLILCSCTPTGKPENTSDRMYGLGMAALEIVDDYLDGKSDIEAAYALFSAKVDEVGIQHENSKMEVDSDSLFGTKYSNDAKISHNVVMLDYAIFSRIATIRNPDTPEDLRTTDSNLAEGRNSLAESLGEKAR